MKKTNIYKCSAATRRDKANIYYINCNAAKRIEESANEIRIYNGHGTIIAIFA